MKRKQIPLIICVIGVVSFILIFTLKSRSSAVPIPQAKPTQPSAPPEHVAYYFLFRQTAAFRNAAIKAGKPDAVNPMLLKEAKLNELQTRKLDEITADTLQEVEQQDARARIVIERFRAQYPNGIVPKDQRLPAPPPELKVMQEERNAIILRGRDKLRLALDEQGFSRFHEFVMKQFAGKGLTKFEGQ